MSDTRHLINRGLRGHFYAVTDQLLLSASSFVVIILLVRWSSSGVVGQISVVINALTLVLLAHKGFAETFTVFAAGEEASTVQSRVRESLALHIPLLWVLLGILLLLLSISVLDMSSASITVPALAVALIAANVLYELSRRIAWVTGSGLRAVGLSVVRWFVLIVCAALIRYAGVTVTATLALLWMLLYRLVCIPVLAYDWLSTHYATPRDKFTVVVEYWQFARWILLRNILSYAAGNLYVPIVLVVLGFEATGIFEVGRQLVAPFYVIPMGISFYALPRLAASRKRQSQSAYTRKSRTALAVWIAASAAGALCLAYFGRFWLHMLVGDKPALGTIVGSMSLLATLGFAISLNIAAETLLYAADQPKLAWPPMAVAALCNCIIGVPLVASFGVPGAFLGNAVTSLLAAILVLRTLMSRRSAWRRNH